MNTRWLSLVSVVLLMLALPILAQEGATPWSIEVLDVHAETELNMRVGLHNTTYTAVNDFVFYIVEIALTYTNPGDTQINFDLETDTFWLANESGDRVSASGTAGPMGGCVDCVTTFPLEIGAGESVTLNISLVFVVAGSNVLQRFKLEFKDMEPIPILLGDGSAEPTATSAPPPTATRNFAPTPEGTLALTAIETPFCDEMLELGEMDAEGTYLCIQGDPDDWASGGQELLIQPADAEFALGCAFNQTGVCIRAGDWEMSFEPADGGLFGVGLFEEAQRIPFNDMGHPGMSITWLSACNQIDGTFDVRELQVDETTGEVTVFAAVFEQYCDSETVRLRGMVRWEAEGTE